MRQQKTATSVQRGRKFRPEGTWGALERNKIKVSIL